MESGSTEGGFGTCSAGSLQPFPGDDDKELFGLAGSSFIPCSVSCFTALVLPWCAGIFDTPTH